MKLKVVKTPDNSSKQRVIIKSVPKEQTGGDTPQVDGVAPQDANAELEKKEVFKTTDGDIKQVAPSEPTHEDGGSLQPNVDKVLEETSNMRNDADSKTLKMSPEEVEATTGMKAKRSMSHSQAFTKSSDYWDKQLNKVQNKIEKAYEDAKLTNSPFAKNSLKHNVGQLQTIPTKAALFDNLFDHQEQVKQQNGITNEGEQAQVGGIKTGRGYLFNEDDRGYIGQPQRVVNPQGIPTQQPGFNTPNNLNPVSVQNYANTFNLADKSGMYPTMMDVDMNLRSFGHPGVTPDYSQGTYNYSGDQAQDQNNDLSSYYSGAQPTYTNNQQGNGNKFNEPLHWYDLAGPLMRLTDAGRRGTKYNSVNLYEPHVRQLDVRPELERNLSSFNAVRSQLNNSTTGQSNLANLLAQKYSGDNQAIGQYENMNKQKQDQQDQISAETRNKQQLIDQQARATQEQQQLRGEDAQRTNRLSAWDDIFNRIAQNNKLNREGNLLMHMVNYYDQNGNYNGKKYVFNTPNGIAQSSQNNTAVPIGTNPYTGQTEYKYKIQTGPNKFIYVKPSQKQIPIGVNLNQR